MLFRIVAVANAPARRMIAILMRPLIVIQVLTVCLTTMTFASDRENDFSFAGNPPLITGITVNSITAFSVVVNWTTDVPSTSQVIYDSAIAYSFSTLVDSTLVTSHAMILDGLIPGRLYHYKVLSAGIDGILTTSSDNTFTTSVLAPTLGNLNTHTVRAYPAGKIVPWTSNPADGYNTAMSLSWNYLLNGVPNDPATGKPAYYSRSFLDPTTTNMVNWPHNPAGTYAMFAESALKYFYYTGDTNVMRVALDVALWHLDHGMTSDTNSWAGVPYSSGDPGSLTYDGADAGNLNGQGDGHGFLEPDKVGELGNAWLELYKYNGNTRFKDAAIQAGNVLSNKVRAGMINQSPWPFRVNANTGAVREEYCAHTIAPIALLDNLIACGFGDTAAYRTARTTAWNWMMTYPMQNNNWAQYFEDVAIQGTYNNNLNQYTAMMAARYLLEHPEFDPNWEAHVRGLISWVETKFGEASFGALSIREQDPVFAHAMGSHTARYASVNALLYEKTGDLVAKEKAYRAFNWATYMARNNGVVIDGPDVNTQWFTDGYGDYVRHFITGMSAAPDWVPANQNRFLRTTSVLKNISYGTTDISYTTFNPEAIDVLHITFNPVTVTADAVVLPYRSDLSQPGWTLDVATKTLRIYHTNATQISISAGESVRSICPGDNTYFFMPKPGNGYTYQWQIDSTGTGFIDLVANPVYTGISSDTLRLNVPPTPYYGYKYRCIASKNGTSFSGPVYVLKFAVTWQGTTGTAWENITNWSCNYVPDLFTDVIIPGGLVNNPVIGSDAQAHSITVSPGSVVTVSPGIKLDIKGK